MAGKKKNPNTKYAFIGLLFALLGCVSTGLIGAANTLISMGMFTLENTQPLTLALQTSVAVLGLGLAVFAILSPDSIRRFFTGRQARYGSNSLILALAVLGILFVANYIVFNNPKSWDLTEDKSNTLSNETLQILATLPEKVTATAFYSTNLSTASADELLLKFKTNSQGKFDYAFVDPDTNPVAAREAGITGDGKIMLEMGGAKEIASFVSEEELARSLIRLISPEPRAVYFLQGHGEPALQAGGDISYSIAQNTLESKNYTVGTINLLTDKAIPEGALAIIIAGPTKPLSEREVTLLRDYVNNGGSLVVMEDPLFFTEFGESPDPLAEYLTRDWGITLNEDLIIDFSGVTQNMLYAASLQYNTHPITQNLNQQYIVILPQARSISISATVEGINATPLLNTSENSWGETSEIGTDQNPEFDETTDFPGPLTMAAAGENSTTNGRVVVIGNSIFASDDVFDAYGNGNLFVNSVDWAAEQEDLLTIPVRETTPRTFLPPTQVGSIILVLMVIIIIPGMFVFAGFYSWFTRRKKG